MVDLKRINAYCEAHSSPPSNILLELERETYLKTLAPQMLSGRLQGQLLSFVSKWLRPDSILEIGTFTGYGTICLSAGLAANGIIHTIEVNPELAYISNKYFKKTGIDKQVIRHTGDAKDIIPTIGDAFDLVYLDAGKHDYESHYDLIIEKIKEGGVILADNVLWSGKVGINLNDKDTKILESFNKKVHQDNRVENLLLPVRDGLMVIIKK
ncbi:MAG: O-methyltransferase [Bacteroidota bacterium]